MNPVSYENEIERSGQLIFTVRGVSMRPLFHAKTDAILVKKCDPGTLTNLDIVLFKRGSQYVLHRIVDKRSDGRFVIAGDNCDCADIVAPGDILGVVVSAQRGSKPIKLGGARYAMYERLWCKPYRMRFAVLHLRTGAKSAARKILRRGR